MGSGCGCVEAVESRGVRRSAKSREYPVQWVVNDEKVSIDILAFFVFETLLPCKPSHNSAK
jgi:hypothetical protein